MAPAARAISTAASRSAIGSMRSAAGASGAMRTEILAVRAIATGIEARLGREAGGPDPRRGFGEAGAGLFEMPRVQGGAAARAAVHEVELHAGRHHLPGLVVGEGVETQLAGLQTLHRSLHGALFFLDIGGL